MSVADLEPFAKAIEALNKLWTPHPKQIPVGKAIFRDGVKRVFLNQGRRFGKSNLIANIVVRTALAKPYSACVILCPTIKAAKKIYWISGIIKRMVPAEFIDRVNETELRVILKNGSYIEVTGADDPDSLRGTGIAIYAVDEAKDHKPDVLNTITPGLIDNNGILVVGGTPPGIGGKHHFWDWVEQAKNDPKWRYFQATSYDNPHLDPKLIDEEKAAHIARGEEDVFTREYMATPAMGVKTAVYGMFNRAQHIHPFEILLTRVRRRESHWTFMCAMDPGSASVFAVLIGAVNNHTGEVVLLNELYADRVMETSIGTVWPKVQKMMDEIYQPDPHDEQQWSVVYDEAAKWAQVELQDVFDVNAFPTQKALNRKSFGVSILKDLYLNNKIAVSERCLKFVEETEGYQTDKNGNFIKDADHLLAAARYLIHGAHYTPRPSTPPPDAEETPIDEQRRAYTPAQDMLELFGHAPVYLSEMDDY